MEPTLPASTPLPPNHLDLGLEDEDVIFEGSPLHEYLCQEGWASEIDAQSQHREPIPPLNVPSAWGATSSLTSSGVQWPQETSRLELEIEVAQRLLGSELLVPEDEDFISNFILTDEALATLERKNAQASGRSFLGDALFFSGSLVAVVGTVLYLSERTRLAATAAAVLPTALAALSAARHRSTGAQAQAQERAFLQLVEQLLADMKIFRQLVRKSLNLLQGMELMHSGYMFAVNTSTGGPVPQSGPSAAEESHLARALAERASFPALRKAVYRSARQMIQSYREAVSRLMEIGPLADHVDLKEHYIAFIDLSHFGIEESEDLPPDHVSVKVLKDVVQLTLIQQSEYLRRFSLAFCERVREDHGLDENGVVNQVKDLVSSIRQINTKLGKVFDVHQAMGLVSDKKNKALLSRRQKIDLLPLRTIYTSLFSSGLHLQNSLLKIRDIEKHFDQIDKSKTSGTDMFAALLPSDDHLLEWLRGFQAVQSELNACVGCLDEGVSQIDFLQAKEKVTPKLTPVNPEIHLKEREEPADVKVVKMSVATSTETQDEVFEAVIKQSDDETPSESEFEDTELVLEKKKYTLERMQSDRVLEELRGVLIQKAAQRERREAIAVARMNGDVEEEMDRDEEEVIVKAQQCSKPLNGKCSPTEDFPLFSKVASQHESADKCDSQVIEDPRDAWTPVTPGVGNSLVNRTAPGFEDDFCRNDFETLRVPQSKLEGSPGGSDSSSQSASTSSGPATVRSVRNYHSVKRESDSSSNAKSSSSIDSLDENDSDGELDELWSVQGNPRRATAKISFKVRTVSVPNALKAAPSLGSLAKLKAIKSNPMESLHGGSCSLSELRCISSPDLTRLLKDDPSSPYVSLEDLKQKGQKSSHYWNNVSDSESECGSADDLQHQVLKTYRRPLRPAAMKRQPSNGTEGRRTTRPDITQGTQAKAKRLRNRTISLEKKDVPSNNGDVNGHANHSNSYVSKNHSESNPLFLPTHPVGFNASLAAQAAAKAMSGFNKVAGFTGPAFQRNNEEVFGSDSD